MLCKYLLVCSLLLMLGCTSIKLDVHDADAACSGSDLDVYIYRAKGVNITVKCKSANKVANDVE